VSSFQRPKDERTLGGGESHIRALRLGFVGQCGCSGNASGSLATLGDGSTVSRALIAEA
jgi:hypothetical protein